jgi:aspartate/methionine/tyrosine aminotransferase
MLDVQAPVIPLVADLIRRHPGTISLGQGVVHYGPPPRVAEAVAAAVAADPRVDRYGLAFGLDDLLDPIRAKLAAENGTVVEDGPAAEDAVAVEGGPDAGAAGGWSSRPGRTWRS